MRLDYNALALQCCISNDSSECKLRAWMQVKLWLLEIDKLPRLSHMEGYNNGQCLGNAEAHIGDIDHIFGSVAIVEEPVDQQLNVRACHLASHDFIRQT